MFKVIFSCSGYESLEKTLDEKTTIKEIYDILSYNYDWGEVNINLEKVEKIMEKDLPEIDKEDLRNRFMKVKDRFSKEFEKIEFEDFYENENGRRNLNWIMCNDLDCNLYEAISKIFLKYKLEDIRFLYNNLGDHVSIENYWEDGISNLINMSGTDNTETVKYLLESGASVNSRCIYGGYDSLDCASASGKLENVKLLVEYGATINRDEYNSTALIAASENGHVDVVKYLLDHGACISDRDTPRDKDRYTGKTALEYAVKNGHTEIIKLLKEAENCSLNNDNSHNERRNQKPKRV